MSLLKKLAGETAIYGLSSVLGRMINYLLVILHTRVFLDSSYGIQAELYSYVAFLNIIYTYGMETTFFRFATRGSLLSTFRQIASAHMASTFLLSALLFLLSEPLVNLMGYPGKAFYIQFLAGVLALDTLSTLPLARLRLEKKAWRFASIKLLNIGLNVFLNVFFLFLAPLIYKGEWLPGLQESITYVYSPEYGVAYIFLANFLASALQFVLLLPQYRGFRFEFSWPSFRPLLLYAYPLIFTGLAAMINEMLDRPLLKYYLPDDFYPGKSGLAAMGIYAACYKLSIFMSIAVQAFKYAAEPFFFSQAEDRKAPELFAKVMHYFILTGVLIWVLVSANLDLLKWLFLQREVYWEGIGVVPILLLANLFLGIYYNLAIWFKISDRTHFGLWISFFGAGITLILNISLIPYLGYYGSAWATLAAYLSMSLLCFYWGQKYYPIPYAWKKALLNLGLGGLVIILMGFLSESNYLWNLILKNGLALLLLGLFYVKEKKNPFKI